MANQKWMLRKFIKTTDSVMKQEHMDIECRFAHCIALIEITYIRLMKKRGMSKEHMQLFLTDRYFKALKNL